MILAEVWVPGHSKTKGSLDFVTKSHVREAVPGSGRWRQLVAARVKEDAEKRYPDKENLGNRIGVRIVSYLQPSRQMLDKGEAGDWILGRSAGDVDKLARNVLDALTDSGVIGDDAQVWDLMSSKRLAKEGMMPGQQIQVWLIPDSAPW